MVQIGNFHIGRADTAKPPILTVGEAFALWDHLVSRYDIIMQTQLYQNYAHDPDFKLMLSQGLVNILEKQVDVLEKELDLYKMPLPQRPPKSVKFEANSTIYRDEFIFRSLFTGIQNFLDSHIRTIRVMVVNDPLRKIFTKFMLEELDAFDDICKFGKVKGWLQVPIFTNYQVEPIISTGEAYLLWDNLLVRYDLIHLIQTIQNSAHDIDLKDLLAEDLAEVLEKQVNVLEKMMNKYKLPLPDRPPKSVNVKENTGFKNDEFIFRRYFTSVQDFLELCVRTIRASVTDDNMRTLYIKYLHNKLDIFDELCKYGKLKGWLEIPPFMQP